MAQKSISETSKPNYYQMSLIIPALYIGCISDVNDESQMEKNKITHVVSVHDTSVGAFRSKKYTILNIYEYDDDDTNLVKYFSSVNDFVHSARCAKGAVLIHCLAGRSRSVTLAIAYIMTTGNISFSQAFQIVRNHRSIAEPNEGFQSQLKEFEKLQQVEVKRFREKFNQNLAQSNSDREECDKILKQTAKS